jgi:hypothetical protein
MSFTWRRVPNPSDRERCMAHVMPQIRERLGDVEITGLKKDLDPHHVSYCTTYEGRVKQKATGKVFSITFYDMRGTMVEIRPALPIATTTARIEP